MNIIKQTGKSIVKDRTEAIDRILTWLSLAEDQNATTSKWTQTLFENEDPEVSRRQRLPLNYFNGVEPFAYESLMNTTATYERVFWSPEDPDLHNLAIPWDSSTLAFEEAGVEIASELGKQYMYSLSRVRSLPLKELRGLIRFQTGILCEVALAFLFSDGTYVTCRVFCELRRGLWMIVAVPGVTIEPRLFERQNHIWVHKSASLTNEYDWRVHLGYSFSNLPTIAIPTDPIGSREMFKLRELPAGKTRREALRHWVLGHWRTHGEPTGEDESWVLPFMRGAFNFKWNGLECKIEPSAHDLKRAQKYEQMRQQKKARHA